MLKLPHHGKAERRRVIRRMIRRLEQRDGAKYTRTHGPERPGSRLFVSVAALEQLTPWDAGTLTAMREDIDGLGTRVKRAERRIDGHDRDIHALRVVQQKASEFAEAVAMALGQSGPQPGQKQQLSRRGTDGLARSD